MDKDFLRLFTLNVIFGSPRWKWLRLDTPYG